MRLGILATFLFTSAIAQSIPDKPLLVFSTYLGGDRDDVATAVATDSDGATYVAGETTSKNFPAKTLNNTVVSAVNNAFVTKYSAEGKVVWSLMIGGASATRPNAIARDGNGNLWITGRTGARDFPLLNPVQDKHTGLNIAFLMKLSPEGKLLFSTYLGGERNDEANAIAIDPSGSVYIAGRTNSTTFPLKNAFNKQAAGGDAFIAKFTNDGKLEWSTYFGGTSADEIFGIAIGPDGDVYVAGECRSPNLATENAWQKVAVGTPGCVARLSAAGDQLRYFTYVTTRTGYNRALGIDVDAAGNAYVVGTTSSKDFPTTEGAIQPKFAGGLRDAFLLRLNPEGAVADYVTYLGGSFSGQSDPDEAATAVRLDSHGYAYITGFTASSDFHSYRPAQANTGGLQDSWVARIDVANGKLISSTVWGGSKIDSVAAIALGPEENFTFVGQTTSTDFTLQAAAQPENGAKDDATIVRLCDPWLRASAGELRFTWVLGQSAPEPQKLDVFDGCSVKHELTEAVGDAAWLNVSPDRAALPGAKITAAITPGELAVGQYNASIKLTTPSAANGSVIVPVILDVVEPPKQSEEALLH